MWGGGLKGALPPPTQLLPAVADMKGQGRDCEAGEELLWRGFLGCLVWLLA